MTRERESEDEEIPTVWTPDSIDELSGELPDELPEGFVEGIESKDGMLLFIKKDLYIGCAKFPGVMYQHREGKWLKCGCRECGRPGNPPGGRCSYCAEDKEINPRFGLECIKWDLLTGMDFICDMDCTTSTISKPMKDAIQKAFDNDLSSSEAYALHEEVRKLCWSNLNKRIDPGRVVDALLMFTSILSHICDWEEYKEKHETDGSITGSDRVDSTESESS
jgi:hypothetical protein